MANVILMNDLLDEEIYSDPANPQEPKIENPHWGLLQTYDMWAGGTLNANTINQSAVRNGADWRANQMLKPPPDSRKVRAWDFSDVVGAGDATVNDLLAPVRDYWTLGYYFEVANFTTYWRLPLDDPDLPIETMSAMGTTFYVPNSYNQDEQGNITTQKTWAEWAGPNQTIFDLGTDGIWVASFAGVVGNFATCGSVLWLMDLRNVVDAMLTNAEFQALLPDTP